MKEYIELAPYKCTSNYDCMHLFLIALPYIFNPDWHPLSNTYLVDGLLKHYAKALRRIPIYIRSEMEEDMKDKKCAKCNDSADALYELCDANKSQHYFCSSHEDIIGNAYTLLKRNTR